MKIKPTKICKRKGCTNEFKIFRTTDKYCSYECANLDNPKKPKKQTAIKPYSEKRRKESYLYSKKRKTFLSNPDNLVCIVEKAIFNETLLTTEIHHKKGRRGKLLNYVPYWLAISRKGHEWVHANPEKAYKLGFLIRSTSVNI